MQIQLRWQKQLGRLEGSLPSPFVGRGVYYFAVRGKKKATPLPKVAFLLKQRLLVYYGLAVLRKDS